LFLLTKTANAYRVRGFFRLSTMTSRDNTPHTVDSQLAHSHAWFALFNLLMNEKPITSIKEENNHDKRQRTGVQRVQEDSATPLQVPCNRPYGDNGQALREDV